MRFIILSTASLFIAVLILSRATAVAVAPSEEDYIFDIAKKNPKIQKAWAWIVPRAFKDHRWLNDLSEATSGPVDRVIISGKRFILGSACWPHNCGGNHVVYLIAADGSEAYGLLFSETLHVSEAIFGVPDEPKLGMSRNVRGEIEQQR